MDIVVCVQWVGVSCPDLKSLNPCYIACQSVLSEENLEDGNDTYFY